jgi:hypothetical protein
LSGTTLPVSTLCLWDNLSRITSCLTTLSVSELRGMTVYTKCYYAATTEFEVRGAGMECGRIWGGSQKFSIPFNEDLDVNFRWDIPVVFNVQ